MTEQIKQRKSEIRADMRARLSAMREEERRTASAAACAKVVAHETFRHAGAVMLYMPLSMELDVTGLAIRCFQDGRTVCVPRVDWKRREMDPVDVTSFDDHYMEIDEHGLRTPRHGRVMLPTAIDLVIVPGLAFDTSGRRLGRGGGFYDRFLARLRPSAATIGIAFDVQVIEDLPADVSDMSVDILVTDRRISIARASRSRH